jgi:hypothetical protein
MKTVTVQIGNTDDKLTQRDWSDFAHAVHGSITELSHQLHFSGGASPIASWQNWAWVFEIDDEVIPLLKSRLGRYAAMYNQDSIAWTEGVTQFVEATP